MFMLKAMMSIVMLIVTGALFGTVQDILDALAWGSLLGELLNKGNNAVNYIQDWLVEIMVREAVFGHVNSVGRDLSMK